MTASMPKRLTRGLVAGVQAGLAFTFVSLLLRVVAGVPLVADLVGDRVIPTLHVLTFVRLIRPLCVMVMMTPSFAMRSSIAISPSSGTISVRRGVACFALISWSSFVMIAITRDSLARMSSKSLIRSSNSVYSSRTLSISKPVRR